MPLSVTSFSISALKPWARLKATSSVGMKSLCSQVTISAGSSLSSSSSKLVLKLTLTLSVKSWPLSASSRRFSPEFKTNIVAQCRQPGVSVARIALDNDLNANLVRRWVSQAREVRATPGFMPISLPAIVAQPANRATTNTGNTIRIEIPRAGGAVVVEWPAEQAHQCAALFTQAVIGGLDRGKVGSVAIDHNTHPQLGQSRIILQPRVAVGNQHQRHLQALGNRLEMGKVLYADQTDGISARVLISAGR